MLSKMILHFGHIASWVSVPLEHQAFWPLNKKSKYDEVKITSIHKYFGFCFSIS